MNLNLQLSLFILIITLGAYGQGIENGGFEFWEDAGTVIDEPTNWSSIKTSDAGSLINNAAPVVWGQSDDAHTGNYSINLFNVSSFGIVATGTITNGRIHADFNPEVSYSYTSLEDAGWNTPFTGRPDSVVVWAKFEPSGSDTAQVKILLHKGDGSLPPNPDNEGNRVGYAQINITGTVNSWTRFAAPFVYSNSDNPEYLLAVLTSGAGTQAVEGSKAYYDDLQLVGDASYISSQALSDASVHASKGYLYLENFPDDFTQGATAYLYTLSGSLAWTKNLENHQSKIKIDTDKGPYILKISGKEGHFSQKLFIR